MRRDSVLCSVTNKLSKLSRRHGRGPVHGGPCGAAGRRPFAKRGGGGGELAWSLEQSSFRVCCKAGARRANEASDVTLHRPLSAKPYRDLKPIRFEYWGGWGRCRTSGQYPCAVTKLGRGGGGGGSQKGNCSNCHSAWKSIGKLDGQSAGLGGGAGGAARRGPVRAAVRTRLIFAISRGTVMAPQKLAA